MQTFTGMRDRSARFLCVSFCAPAGAIQRWSCRGGSASRPCAWITLPPRKVLSCPCIPQFSTSRHAGFLQLRVRQFNGQTAPALKAFKEDTNNGQTRHLSIQSSQW